MNKWQGQFLSQIQKPLLSLVLLALLSGLTACQFMRRSLVAEQSFQLGNQDLSKSSTSAYVRQFRCANVDAVGLKLLRITSGETQTAWDGTHSRVAGTSSPSCLLAIFYRENDEPYIDFSFSGQLTTASGRSEKIVRNADTYGLGLFPSPTFELPSADDSERLEEPIITSWEMLPDTSIPSGVASLLYWRAAIPEIALPQVNSTDVVGGRINFSSVQDIEDYVRNVEGSVFWVVTIEPTE